MHRLKGLEARMIPPTWKEDLCLQFSGEDWGCDAGKLWVSVDDFWLPDWKGHGRLKRRRNG
ncbi:hypothetical protein BDV19DRAFT_171686 [Aspergillus venezuelensis]